MQPLITFEKGALKQILVFLFKTTLVALRIALVPFQHFFYYVYQRFFYKSANVVPKLAMAVVDAENMLRVVFRPLDARSQNVRILIYLVRVHRNVADARCKSIFRYHVFWYVEFV